MTTIREGARGARSVCTALNTLNWTYPLKVASSTPAFRRHATTEAVSAVAAVPESPPSPMSLLETKSALTTPRPTDKKSLRKLRRFNPRGTAIARRYELPGTRYQYHPPKYQRGPLHPVQPPPSSDPISRQFVPGPFNIPRLKQSYYDAMAHDVLTVGYTHTIPGTDPGPIPRNFEDRLFTYDGSSPYHKNRGPRRPRGTSDRLPLLEHDITFTNVPRINQISISCFIPEADKERDSWVAGWTALRNITGKSPWNLRIRHPIPRWKTQKLKMCGVKTTLKGDPAYEFLDKVINFVFPRIKNWPGFRMTTGDKNGGIQFGLTPEQVSQLPEIRANWDMYPVKLIPGMQISIGTTAQSNRHARLLMLAMGIPFTYTKKAKAKRVRVVKKIKPIPSKTP